MKIPTKPTPIGFKMWIVAQKGYFLSWLFHVPGQKKKNGRKIGPQGVTTIPALGKNKTAAIVPHLTKKLPNWAKGKYHVFTDNLFTSSKLAEYLHDCRIGNSGTARRNAGIHQRLVDLHTSEKRKDNKQHPWGYTEIVCVNQGKITQMGWKDNALVLHMSNYYNCKRTVQSERCRPKRTSIKQLQYVYRLEMSTPRYYLFRK